MRLVARRTTEICSAILYIATPCTTRSMRCAADGRPSTAPCAKRILVVGGGFAGLAAAKTLQEQSTARVTLLEASEAVGGRAKSALLADGQKVELGATWLHGSEGHPVFELAVQYGLMKPADLSPSTHKNFWKGSRYYRQGEAAALAGDEERLAKHAISAFAEAVDEAEDRTDIATAGQHLRPKFQELLRACGSEERDAAILRDAWHWRELLQRNIDGSDSTDDSAVEGLAEYEDLSGPWGAIPGGYQTVAERMASDLMDVRCGMAVEQIRWGPQGVSVACVSGETFTADAVVVTIPLGVLKATHASMFQPSLPEQKADAIHRLGVGVVDKVFVTFDLGGAAKGDLINSYNLFWAANENSHLPGTNPDPGPSAIERCIDASASEHSRAEGGRWQEGIYAFRFGGSEFIRGEARLPDDSKVPAQHRMGRHSIGLDADGRSFQKKGKPALLVPGCPLVYLEKGCPVEESVAAVQPQSEGPPDAQSASAVIWVAGHHAVDMERASEDELAASIGAALDAFPAMALPHSFQVVRSRWGADPFSRGSYSYVSARSCGEDVSRLSEPLAGAAGGAPVVCFAGEATSRRHMGTTTGAFLSGVNEASRLMDALKIRRRDCHPEERNLQS